MAKAGKPRVTELPPEWRPTQAPDDPILCGPYLEPDKHWLYDKGVPRRQPGRREAGYYFTTEKVGTAQQGLFAEEQRDKLELVNRLRADVRRWRESGYRGASSVTRDLFTHWFGADRSRRLFFCQREAIETVVYLLELVLPGNQGKTGYKSFQVERSHVEKLLVGREPVFIAEKPEWFSRLVDHPEDDALLPLVRLGCKMATGSGKTLVMALIITWAFCNRARNPQSTWFPSGVLVCAPNLTVRNRLAVLLPETEGNYYGQFDLIPSKYKGALDPRGVLVTNWHAFQPRSDHTEGGKSWKVVDKGEETFDAFTKDRLGDLAARLPILVLNDEGHHCWRPRGEDKEALKELDEAEARERMEEERQEARVWLAGLDRINNCGLLGAGKRGVLATIDLSATPFYLAGSGYPEGSPFPWLVSDFGLVDAIESGIVKVPRMPVGDDSGQKDDAGRPDPKYFRLWRKVVESLKDGDFAGRRPKPEAIYREAEAALVQLAGKWNEKRLERAGGRPSEQSVPPVMIVVCDNTELARVVYEAISGERRRKEKGEDGKEVERTYYVASVVHPELANSEEQPRRTIQIDSARLAKVEAAEGESRDDAAKALRELIDTVGKRGEPGEQVRCVVSVSMLTEGWDASNVTHILGLRAFGSQLICEQVVGRGLRRMSYDVGEDGRLAPEYVDVYGIPFTLIPFKGRPPGEPEDEKEKRRVFAVPDKASFGVQMPVVESYTYGIKDSGIRCDIEKLTGFVVQHEPTTTWLAVTRGYEDQGATLAPMETIQHTRDEYYRVTRYQQILFRIAQMLVDDLVRDSATNGAPARHLLFPELVRILREYVDTKVVFKDGVDRRELGLEKYARLLRDRVREGVVASVAGKPPLLPIVNSYTPVVGTEGVDYQTVLPVVPVVKCHLSGVVVRSDGGKDGIGERRAVEILEDMDAVLAFAPNDRRIGFAIPFEFNGDRRRYEPDFIVRMRGGTQVIVEIKGKGGELHGTKQDEVLAKEAAARKWVAAVNNDGRWGEWGYEIVRHLGELRPALLRHAGAEILPFRVIDPERRKHWENCVPLMSLRAAAGGWSESQRPLELGPEMADEWIAWDGARKFERGMFVARVFGRSMEPGIPHGSYCLFRPCTAAGAEGRKVLVAHSGIKDPEHEGQFTVKVWTVDKPRADGGAERYARIVLKSTNEEFPEIVLTPADSGEVRVVGEVVGVVGTRDRQLEKHDGR